MSTNFYWATPHLPRQTFTLPTGVQYEVGGPLMSDDPKIHIGKRSTAGFSWAQPPEVVRTCCREFADDPVVINEYYEVMTGREFLKMLRADCPVEFTGSVGAWFS